MTVRCKGQKYSACFKINVQYKNMKKHGKKFKFEFKFKFKIENPHKFLLLDSDRNEGTSDFTMILFFFYMFPLFEIIKNII